jgi:flagella basal body P-ring formation protein FlgA
MKKTLKSDKPINAKINKNFVVKVKEPNDKDWKITSANKLSLFVNDEELKIRLFKKVLENGEQQYTISIRNRLKIKFHSK